MKINPETLKVTNNTEENRFEIQLGEQVAMIEYILRGDSIVYTHTGVPREFSGQGIAARLAKTALDFAVERKLKISTMCSYIDVYIQRHPEYQEFL